MAYDLFLFDADETLFDFRASERRAFKQTLEEIGAVNGHPELFAYYQEVSLELWTGVEKGLFKKEFIRGERFNRLFAKHGIDADGEAAGHRYLELLPEKCELIDGAEEICGYLSSRGTIGIITNGFKVVQTERMKVAAISKYVMFMVVSEECGFTKPDVRFFEHTAKLVPGFSKERTLVIGDRLEADIQGAANFGVDACWFNPLGIPNGTPLKPKYEIRKLSDLRHLIP
jgi:2-haloacid dehalogenase